MRWSVKWGGRRRRDRWWMRWYVVRAVRGSTAGGIATDDAEYVECATFTRRGAERVIQWSRNHQWTRTPTWESLRAVRRTAWLEEHL